jgi:hypothetical protein
MECCLGIILWNAVSVLFMECCLDVIYGMLLAIIAPVCAVCEQWDAVNRLAVQMCF